MEEDPRTKERKSIYTINSSLTSFNLAILVGLSFLINKSIFPYNDPTP